MIKLSNAMMTLPLLLVVAGPVTAVVLNPPAGADGVRPDFDGDGISDRDDMDDDNDGLSDAEEGYYALESIADWPAPMLVSDQPEGPAGQAPGSVYDYRLLDS